MTTSMNVIKIVVYVMVLFTKVPVLLINFLRYRRQGLKTFRKELLAAGMTRMQAEELTRTYKSMLLPEWRQLLRFRGRKSAHNRAPISQD